MLRGHQYMRYFSLHHLFASMSMVFFSPSPVGFYVHGIFLSITCWLLCPWYFSLHHLLASMSMAFFSPSPVGFYVHGIFLSITCWLLCPWCGRHIIALGECKTCWLICNRFVAANTIHHQRLSLWEIVLVMFGFIVVRIHVVHIMCFCGLVSSATICIDLIRLQWPCADINRPWWQWKSKEFTGGS